MDKNKQLDIIKQLHELIAKNKSIPFLSEFLEATGLTEWSIRIGFGSYEMLLRAAGVDKHKNKRLKVKEDSKTNQAKEMHADVETLSRIFEKTILAHVGKYHRCTKKHVLMANCSDLHSLWMDPFAFSVFEDTCKRAQPDIINLVGDVADFYAISSYDKDPSRLTKLQSEIDFVKKMILAKLRTASPKAEINFFIGNHEWRLFKYLASQAAGLASLDCLQFDKLFGLKELEINLVANKSFLNPRTENGSANFKIFNECFLLTHGTSTVRFHASAELDRWNMSGSSGHLHRYQHHSKPDVHGDRSWVSMGTMARKQLGSEYVEDLVRWNQGFEIVHLMNKTILREYVHIMDGNAVVGGTYYKQK